MAAGSTVRVEGFGGKEEEEEAEEGEEEGGGIDLLRLQGQGFKCALGLGCIGLSLRKA